VNLTLRIVQVAEFLGSELWCDVHEIPCCDPTTIAPLYPTVNLLFVTKAGG